MWLLNGLQQQMEQQMEQMGVIVVNGVLGASADNVLQQEGAQGQVMVNGGGHSQEGRGAGSE